MRKLMLILCACLAAGAASSDALDVTGTFNASNTGGKVIEPAIETAVAEMNFVTRPIARGRLKKTNPAYQRIRIEREGSQISVQFDEREPIRMSADGSPAQWTREDGEVLEVSALSEPRALTQTLAAEDGKRVNRFSVSPDGAMLTLAVTVTSPRLPKPVTYTLEYRRQLGQKNPHLEFTGGER